MDIRAALKSQYHASLLTLRLAVEHCPDELWAAEHELAAFWHVVYHTLFFAHFYLMPDQGSFQPWERHRHPYQDLAATPGPSDQLYSRSDLLDYHQVVDTMVDGAVDALDLDAETCGFPWYPLPKLDHQLVNLRHIQHHAGQLSERLRVATGEGLDWVGGERR